MKARLLAALLLGASLAAAPAFAHGGKIETSIHDKESFATAPGTFKVSFEHESAITSVMLMTADNQHVAVDFKPSRTMAKEFTIPLPHLAKGSYTLSWKSLAKDGHAMPGEIHFTVTGG
jgi:methionine-rich copper-binding protein CopC